MDEKRTASGDVRGMSVRFRWTSVSHPFISVPCPVVSGVLNRTPPDMERILTDDKRTSNGNKRTSPDADSSRPFLVRWFNSVKCDRGFKFYAIIVKDVCLCQLQIVSAASSRSRSARVLASFPIDRVVAVT